MAKLSPLFTWRSAITESGLPPMSRLVALTLSLHMSERGDSCYPSLTTLVEETGLARSTVVEHLNRLAEKGWLIKESGGGRMKSGRGISSRYRSCIPDGFALKDEEEGSGSRTVPDAGTVRLPDKNGPAAGHNGPAPGHNGPAPGHKDDMRASLRATDRQTEDNSSPSSITGSVGRSEDFELILTILTAHAEANTPNAIRKPVKWRQTTRANIAAELGNDIRDGLADGATVQFIAERLTGDGLGVRNAMRTLGLTVEAPAGWGAA